MLLKFYRCDSKKLDGSDKDPSEMRSGYKHAQKMRAAATFGFGRVYGKGRTPWHKSEVTGEMDGNPSVSEIVSGYMVSLRRRTVWQMICDTFYLLCLMLNIHTAGPIRQREN